MTIGNRGSKIICELDLTAAEMNQAVKDEMATRQTSGEFLDVILVSFGFLVQL